MGCPVSTSGLWNDDNRYAAIKSHDDDINTPWIASSNSNAFLVFDLIKSNQYISGVSIKTKDNNNSPKSCEIQFGSTGKGPWLTAKAFEPVGPSATSSAGDIWHFFSMPVSTEARFIQLYVDDNYGGPNVEVYEVEFFKPNNGVRLRPARGALVGYCEVNGDNQCNTASAPVICKVDRTCACSSDFTTRRLSFPVNGRGYSNQPIYSHAAYACVLV